MSRKPESPAAAEPAATPPTERANALVAEPAPSPASPTAVDAHGFDPADYRWVPVLRRRRADGWSPQRQVAFIEALADGGCVVEAARAAGMSPAACYKLRRSPGAENFAAAWEAALQQATRFLVDVAFDRAIHGSDEPVFDKEGRRVGRRMRQNDRLLMFLLRAHLPERYRHAHQSLRHPSEAAPPQAPPRVAEALLTLAPVEPPDPHLLMSPGALETELQVADVMEGRLPHWYRDQPDDPDPVASPLGLDFERQLEAAKREPAGLPPEPDEPGDDPRRRRR